MTTPQTSMPYWVRRRIFQRELELGDFSGGLNLRDAPTELANNESPDLWNVTLNERGGVEKRLGYLKKNPVAYTTVFPPQQMFEWKSRDVVLTQCGPDVFKDDTVGSVHTFSSPDRCGFAEFGTDVFMIHPADGVFWSTDAVTWTAVAGSPKGTVLEPWQTRLTAAGDPSNTDTVFASALADGKNWSTSDNDRSGTDLAVTATSKTVTSATAAFVTGDVSKKITIAAVDYHLASVTNATTALLDTAYTGSTGTGVAWSISGFGWTNKVREHDSEPIVAMTAASGVDIAGKPGMLVFKRRSLYRINDPDTGSYQTLDVAVGAASGLAVVSSMQRVFFVCDSGIYETDGVSVPTLMSAKLQPLFQDSQIAFDKLDLFCAGAKGDRVHFSLPRAGSAANDLHLEFHPQQGWFVAGSDAASCYLRFTDGSERLYGGSPTAPGQVFEMGVGGDDNGADIACRYQTKWVAPQGGIEARLRRLRVFGRGQFDLYTRLDFDTGPGKLSAVSLIAGAAQWDIDQWDEGLWAPTSYEDSNDFWSLGHGKYVSFVLTETSSLIGVGQQLLSAGSAPQAGAFALYGLILQYVSIGV